MSKQIKIVLGIGVVLVVAAVAYLMWPAGEPEAQSRGLSLDQAQAGAPAE